MDYLSGEFNDGDIAARDHLQFELKSEFFIHPHLKQNIYKQEVLIFVPSPLQIHPETYSKEQFYLDQTTLIRYKTPSMTLADLANPDYSPSPLNRIQSYLHQSPSINFTVLSDELKLFGAIFKSAIRKRVQSVFEIIKRVHKTSQKEIQNLSYSIESLCSEIALISSKYRELQGTAKSRSPLPEIVRHFRYVDEYISTAIEEYLTGLLKRIRSMDMPLMTIEKRLVDLILNEQTYRKTMHMGPKKLDNHVTAQESFLYRQGLLNRFVLESLTLKNYRYSSEEKHRNILGAFAAGIAMFVYMVLFVWHSTTFGFNSLPFVILAVFLYILKDRIKEGFKNLYYKKAPYWFPDYSTEIQNFKGFKVGELKENFAFIELSQLTPEFLKIRNEHFHEELQALQRHESIIQYKREMVLYRSSKYGQERRGELVTIFRLNIHRFLHNASEAFESYQTFDPAAQTITEKFLPKVYHLNLIIRNWSLEDDLQPKEEIKTFRVIVDKRGIQRVENIHYDTHV